MKKRIHNLVITGLLILVTISTYAQIQKPQTGDWKFEAPNAPDGSTIGLAVFKTDNVMMTFDGYEEFPSNWVRMRNDSIFYEVDFGQSIVLFSLKVNGNESMSGKATWEGGVTSIIFTKAEKKGMGVRI